MRLSKYLVLKEVENGIILFSTISKVIIKVTKSFYEEMKSIDINALHEIKLEELKYLKDNYFIIEDDVKEKEIVEYLLDSDRLKQEIFSSYIAFSTLCNFACVYCYEECQTERKFVMDNEILGKVIEWYKYKLLKGNYKKCKITLFGGEPLIHKNLIKKFIKTIKEFTIQENIDLKLAIITNGYLLDQEIVGFLDRCGLEEIQITLDGVGKVHDERRPLRKGGPTFNKIIENITNLGKFGGWLLFRVSFDKSNINNVKELLNYIKNLNIQNEYKVYIAPIHQTSSQCESSCSFCSVNTTEDIEKLLELYIELYNYMHKIGMSVPKYISNGPCMTVSQDTVLIDPHGDLFKCVEMIGFSDLCVGNVKERIYEQKVVNFIGHPCYKKCINEDCKYVCLCGGGCLMKSYLKDGSLNNLDCQYKLFEELIPVLLELNYGNK